MDPIITAPMLVSALSKMLDAAAGEAGRRAWGALTGILGRHRAGKELELAAPPESADAVSAFAESVARLAAADPDLAAELRSWHTSVTVTNVRTGDGDVTANLSGTFHGQVVVTRDVAGPITFN